MDTRHPTCTVALRRLAWALLLAAPLAAQLRPLGDEVMILSDGGCPGIAGHDDGSAVMLRSHGNVFDGGELLSVSSAADGSFSSDHLLDPDAGSDGDVRVTATPDGYAVVWRKPGIYVFPQDRIPGEYAGVALDAAGVATSAPVLLHRRHSLTSPRRVGGFVATTWPARRNGLDVQLLSPLGEAVSAPVPVVRTRWDIWTLPQAVLHRPDGRFTVLWTELGRQGGEIWMRRVSAGGRPIGPAVQLLPALGPGLQRQVSAAIAADGTLALAWTVNAAPGYPKLRTFTATGVPLGPVVTIVNRFSFIRTLSFGARGDVLVLWHDEEASWPKPFRASLFSRRGEPLGAAVDVAGAASAATPLMVCADVAATGSGPDGESWKVFWRAESQTDDLIFARRFVFDPAAGAGPALSGSPR